MPTFDVVLCRADDILMMSQIAVIRTSLRRPKPSIWIHSPAVNANQATLKISLALTVLVSAAWRVPG